MAIIALPSNGVPVNIITQSPLEQGQALVYDASIGSFVNKSDTRAACIKGARNAGGESSLGPYRQKCTDGTLEFFQFIPGAGLSIVEDGNKLIFSSDTGDAQVSVSEDYTIVIDNDGNSADSVFKVATADLTSPIEINISALPPMSFTDIYLGNDSGSGYIRAINSYDFVSIGYMADMIIGVSGSHAQDGWYLVSDVETIMVSGNQQSTIYFDHTFTGDQAYCLGLQPKVELKQASVWVPDNDGDYTVDYDLDRLYALQFWGVEFGPSGYNLQPGMMVQISGSEDGIIDGTYEIAQVFPKNTSVIYNWTGLLFSYRTPLVDGLTQGVVLDFDLVNNELTLRIESVVRDTGFTVDKNGCVTATKVLVSALPQLPNELTSKAYVDNLASTLATQDDFNNFVSAVNTDINNIGNTVDILRNRQNKALRHYLLHARY